MKQLELQFSAACTRTGTHAPRKHQHKYSSIIMSVAVIGGGVAGLSCARVLSATHRVTVYDTGKHRPGGRCSSRNVPLPNGGKPVPVDHAVQFFTASDGNIRSLVE